MFFWTLYNAQGAFLSSGKADSTDAGFAAGADKLRAMGRKARPGQGRAEHRRPRRRAVLGEREGPMIGASIRPEYHSDGRVESFVASARRALAYEETPADIHARLVAQGASPDEAHLAMVAAAMLGAPT